MDIQIFIPCFIDQLFPATGMNMVRILERFDCNVHYNPEQTCCGQLAFNSGFWEEAGEIGKKCIRDLSPDMPVVTPSASCAGYIKNFYDELFYNSSYHLEYKQLIKNLYEFTDFMVNVLKVDDVGATFEHKVTYHDSCAALREYKLGNEPRILLSKVRGLELVEMKDNLVCCGFGGTFSVKHEPIASAMAEQKVNNAVETGAEYIVSTDSSCLMHQSGYISKHKIDLKVIHIADVLASGW
jgi:L-lactate dehydrogenase complex protein LldE